MLGIGRSFGTDSGAFSRPTKLAFSSGRFTASCTYPSSTPKGRLRSNGLGEMAGLLAFRLVFHRAAGVGGHGVVVAGTHSMRAVSVARVRPALAYSVMVSSLA